MSDREGGADDDVGLPKATVFKLIQGESTPRLCSRLYVVGQCDLVSIGHTADFSEMLPEDIACSKEAKDVIVECCVGESASSSRWLRPVGAAIAF